MDCRPLPNVGQPGNRCRLTAIRLHVGWERRPEFPMCQLQPRIMARVRYSNLGEGCLQDDASHSRLVLTRNEVGIPSSVSDEVGSMVVVSHGEIAGLPGTRPTPLAGASLW